MIRKRPAIGNDMLPARPAPPGSSPLQPPPKSLASPRRTTAVTATPKPQPATPPASTGHPAPVTRHQLTKPKPARAGFWERFQLLFIILGGVVLGFMAQSAIIGQLLIVIYGIACLIWRIASRTTFLLATLTIVATIIIVATQNNSLSAQNFASYAFLLLVVGIITSAREMREQRRLHTKKRGAERYAR